MFTFKNFRNVYWHGKTHSAMINFKIQGCQIYPKDRSRGRDSFELQRTGHSHQGGEVIGTREPSSMISEL